MVLWNCSDNLYPNVIQSAETPVINEVEMVHEHDTKKKKNQTSFVIRQQYRKFIIPFLAKKETLEIYRCGVCM